MTTTLVTGATGFVGSHLVDELLARGTSVRALVRSPAAAEALRARGVDTIVGDICDAGAVTAAMRGVDVVHHCAFVSGPGLTRRAMSEANLQGARNLLDALRQAGRGRAVLITGLSVLGLRNGDPIAVDRPYRASGDSDAAIKIRIERLARAYQEKHGVEVVILRPAFIFGPRDRRNLPQLVNAVRDGGFLYIGSRHNVVPLVHVCDMARMMILAGESARASGRVYHVADGSRVTIGQMIEHLAFLLGRQPPRWVLPYFLPYLGCVAFGLLRWLGLGWIPAPITPEVLRFIGRSRFVDIGSAREELGYEPQVNWREGLSAAVRQLEEQHHEQHHESADAALGHA